jgi:phospholipase C
VKHNPQAYYQGGSDRAACTADDVPLGTTSAGALAADLDANSLPAFSFVTPDLCHDTHDCSVASGDAWLNEWIPRLLSSASYSSGATAVFLIWDEPTPMPNILIAPSVHAGTTVSTRVDHYALLRTTEELLGIHSFLGQAASAPSLRSALGA